MCLLFFTLGKEEAKIGRYRIKEPRPITVSDILCDVDGLGRVLFLFLFFAFGLLGLMCFFVFCCILFCCERYVAVVAYHSGGTVSC